MVDKHWGSDAAILKMRDRLRGRRGKYWERYDNERRRDAEQPSSENGADGVHGESSSEGNDGTRIEGDATDEASKAEAAAAESERRKKQKPPKKQRPKGPPPPQKRPPVFLIPGLASTRLVSWKHKSCPQSALLSDVKVLDHVWLNVNLLIQMATIDVRCCHQGSTETGAWSSAMRTCT